MLGEECMLNSGILFFFCIPSDPQGTACKLGSETTHVCNIYLLGTQVKVSSAKEEKTDFKGFYDHPR